MNNVHLSGNTSLNLVKILARECSYLKVTTCVYVAQYLNLNYLALSSQVSCVVNINGCTFAACYGITYNGRHIPAIE